MFRLSLVQEKKKRKRDKRQEEEDNLLFPGMGFEYCDRVLESVAAGHTAAAHTSSLQGHSSVCALCSVRN